MSHHSWRYYLVHNQNDIPEEWIIFVDLVQKALLEQNVTTDPPMTESMEIVL